MAGKVRQRALPADAKAAVEQGLRDSPRQHTVRQGRAPAAGQFAQAVDVAEALVAPRAAVLVIILRQKFGFEPRHVHRRRAFGLAGFATHAEFHRCVHARAGEFFVRKPAGERGAQQVGATAGAVLLLARGHEAGAHGAAAQLAADRGAVAHLHFGRKAVGEVEFRGQRNRLVAGAAAQLRVLRRRVDDVAGVEEVLRVERRLDLLEEPVEVGAIECLIEPTAHTAVAVFAGERAAVGAQQFRRELGDGAHLLHFRRLLDVDQRADVEAAGAGVGVIGHAHAQVATERLDARDVGGQVLRRHRGVLDKGQRLPFPAHAHQQAEAHLAQAPDVGLARAVEQRRHRADGERAAAQARHEIVGSAAQFRLAGAVVFHRQEAERLALHKAAQEAVILRLGARHLQAQVVDQLHGGRAGFENGSHRLQRRDQRRELHDHQRSALRSRCDLELEFGDGGQRAFGAGQQVDQIEALILGQVVVDAAVVDETRQVVAAAAPPVARGAPADRAAVALVVDQIADLAIDGCLSVALLRVPAQLLAVQGAEVRGRTVVQDHLHLQHMIHGHAVENRVAARGIVGDDAAQTGAIGRGGIWPKVEAMGTQRGVERVEHQTRLHPRPALGGVDLQDLIQVARGVDDQRGVDRLPGQAAAAGAGQDGRLVFRRQFDCGLDVVGVAGDEHAVGHHLVEAGVGAVERARVEIAAQVAGNPRLERRQEVAHCASCRDIVHTLTS